MGLFGKDDFPPPAAGSCPNCGSTTVAPVCSLYYWTTQNGKVALVPDGFRLSCQRCAESYSVNSAGVFKQHAQALPWSPQSKVLDDIVQSSSGPGLSGLAAREGQKVPPRPPNAANDPLPMRFPKSR